MSDGCGQRGGDLLSRLWKFGKGCEDLLLILLLLSMIGLAGLLIVLRNIFDSGLIWGDELLRIQVLWLCLVGAIAASRDDNHINIDLLSRFLPTVIRRMVRMATDLFTFSVCAVLAWYSWRFVRIEAEFGAEILTGYPAWAAQAILPIGFALIAYRYLWHLVRRFSCFLSERGGA